MQETKRADPGLERVYWHAAGCPVIAFRRQVLDGINAEITHAMNAVPRRGAEAGGILLGSRTDSDVVIEDFEPVPCEHRFGPSYRLSKADLQTLDETLLWFREQSRGGLSVIGFYRSHTRPEFMLAPEDHRVFATYFASPEQMLLLIRPSRLEQSVADFFVWRNGQLEEAAAPVPFPFRDAAPAPPRTKPEPISEPEPIGPKPVRPKPVRPETVRPEPPRIAKASPPAPAVFEPPSFASELDEPSPPKPAYLPLTIVAVLFAVLGGVLGYFASGTTPPPRPIARIQSSPAPVIRPAVSLPQPPPVHSVEKPPVPPLRMKPKPVEPAGTEVERVLRRWADDIRRGNVDGAARFYTPRIKSYFGKRNATPADVRRSLHATLARYGRLSVNRLSDLKVVPAGRGEAVATFRRHWEAGGAWKHATEQEERVHLALTRSGWKIASENAVRTYWSYRTR